MAVLKDICEEGKVWKLKKPLHGLSDVGRRFWISFKKWIELNGYERLRGDSAVYYKRKNGELIGIILLHMDDVIIGRPNKLVGETTEMIKNSFKMSKVCDGSFRFCGFDIKLQKDSKITVSVDNYALE